ncbi:disease resistance protein RUN1 [Cryptomeria japonica]|uniref:disease resistance protein RUN1 n=1 Tax=Cryptomeria japonica TaxID=3369 RepID=UPI0027DA8047|nr:disease resistance protein RUN1 [Cryptomeria japonica]
MEEYTPSKKISLEQKKYHVFLSFRGSDTRQKLVDHLFESLSAAGIHVFLDSERLRRGENIDRSLRQAIEDTCIHIPIFSTNYADSPWCLKEVTEMRKSTGLIIPLFYDVEPADVRHPDARKYARAFASHSQRKRYPLETITEWKEALQYVSSLSGWSMQITSGYEGKLIKRVVTDVLNTLNNVPLDITKSAVGLKERRDAVIKLLKIGVNGKEAYTVGIWGIGGVGKTTLAKAVYNDIFKKFEAVSFVADVRANAQNINGLCRLQRQILRDLLKIKIRVNNVDHGKALMRERLHSIRALVVLDDVDHKKQIEALGAEWLSAGSRVIVTTRDKAVFNDEICIYPLLELGKDEALQLFCWHSFLKPCPDNNYKKISERIVNACCGLPLSLEVVGAFLYQRKDEICWKETLRQLETARFDDIYSRLKISYQDLNIEEKEIFLDIACFFVGHDGKGAISFWEELNLNPHINLSNLELKSLIKIGYDEIISMHDHLRDMGRAIVGDESRDPGKRSRLWKSNEAYQALQRNPVLDSVQSISFSGSEQSITVENMRSMRNLHLISLDETVIQGDLQPLSLNLRWFRWNSCPWHYLPSEWSMEHLVVLDLGTRKHIPCNIKELWSENSPCKKPKNLKVLLLSWCINLERLPDLSNYRSLLRVDLKNCFSLRKVPESVGLLQQLKCLNLSGCKTLEGLPDSISGLSSLEKLSMNGCSSIRKLPNTFGTLGALKELDIGCLDKIEELPPFGTGSLLKKLILSGCLKLRSLPTSICELKHLNCLVMNKCSSISHLPKELGKLESLRELFVNDCRCLRGLPESFGMLTNLTTLELRKDVSLIELPDNFSRLRSLVQLNASGSHLLNGLPPKFEDLCTLKILNLQNSFLNSLPSKLGKLENLKTLILNKCDKLLELPSLPASLERLEAEDCMQMKAISYFSNLKNLKILALRNCNHLAALPDLSSLYSLIKLDIRGCTNIKSLEGLQGLKSLQELCLSGFIGLDLIQIMKDMPFLRDFSETGMQLNCLQVHDWELPSSSFRDIWSFPVEINSKCAGIVLFFNLELNSKETENNVARYMEISFKRDDEEFFSAKVSIQGAEKIMFIYRAQHPVITSLNNIQRLSIEGQGKGIHIKEGGIRSYWIIDEPCHILDTNENGNNEKNIEQYKESTCGGTEENSAPQEGGCLSCYARSQLLCNTIISSCCTKCLRFCQAVDKETRDMDSEGDKERLCSTNHAMSSMPLSWTSKANTMPNVDDIQCHITINERTNKFFGVDDGIDHMIEKAVQALWGQLRAKINAQACEIASLQSSPLVENGPPTPELDKDRVTTLTKGASTMTAISRASNQAIKSDGRLIIP